MSALTPEDTLLKAATDGMCATSCVVSGFNVAEYLAVPRNQAGFAQDQARVQEEAANVRAWLLGRVESMDQFQKDQYARRFRTLADGDYADDEDLKLYAEAIRHRIAVQTSVDADYTIMIFGDPKYPLGLWLQLSLIAHNQGHFDLIQSWLPQNLTTSTTTEWSKGSMTAGIQRKVPDERALAPSSARCDLEAAMAHTSNVFEFLEGSIDDLTVCARPPPCPNVRPTWCLSLTYRMVRRAFSTKSSQLLL